MNDLDVLLSHEAAKVLEVTPASVRSYERTGQLTAFKTQSGVRLFKLADVLEFKAQREAKRASQTAAAEAVIGVPA